MAETILGKLHSLAWSRFFTVIKWVTHPIVVFVLLQIVWVAVTVLWVIWFINQKEALTQVAETLGNRNIDTTYGIFFLTLGCVLLGILLVGTVLLFVFSQRQTSLIRQQKSFVSSVTHELRSPLASLQLSFETLQKGNIPPNISERLYGMVLRDIERLSRLVDRILISARLDRGLIVFDKEVPFKLRDVIHEVKEQAKYLDQNLDARISIDCPPDLYLIVSKQAMGLVLGNILENAIKYSPAGTPIQVSVDRTPRHITVSVKDGGYGLSRNELRKIFRMFHRSPWATKKAVPGTGLGLFIVRSTVKQFGGEVWAESPGLGKGATFLVSLPSQLAEAESDVSA